MVDDVTLRIKPVVTFEDNKVGFVIGGVGIRF